MVFIQSYSCIAPIDTRSSETFASKPSKRSKVAKAIEPDYKTMVPPAMLRRMSHVIKMGMYTALDALKNSGIENPDAIITGTGLGCFEDTDKFLRQLGEQNETMLAPTSFIQSTHNTVAGQVALQLKCNAYNFTYVHQGLSFESALLDAFLQIENKEAKNVLCGFSDEVTDSTVELNERAGHLVQPDEIPSDLLQSQKGICMGEAAGFFVLSGDKNAESILLKGLKLLPFAENTEELLNHFNNFCKEQNIKATDIDCIVWGHNGDAAQDSIIEGLRNKLSLPFTFFKNICGEFFTASGFALYYACEILKGKVSGNFIQSSASKELKRILIVNHYCNQEYSFILLEK